MTALHLKQWPTTCLKDPVNKHLNTTKKQKKKEKKRIFYRLGRWILHVPHQSMQLRTNKQNKHTHTHREKQNPLLGFAYFPKQPQMDFIFPHFLLVLLGRKPRSHNGNGFVHAKLELHLVKQQKKKKGGKKSKKKNWKRVKMSRTKKMKQSTH